MKQKQFTRLANQLTTIFQGDSLNKLARKCRFMRRERKINPFKLMLSIVSAFGSGKVETLADLQRSYCFMAEETVAYKPFHNQLSKNTFADFMRQTASLVMEKLIQKSLNAALRGTFSEFKRIILQDGSSFAVNDKLASVYPGRFHAISPAAVELHVTYDLLNDQLEAVTLTEDTASERDHLPTPALLEEALLLADAGYFSRDYLASLINAFARFIIKAGHQINPVIVACHTATQKNKAISGMKLKSAFPYLSKSQPNDLMVQWQTSEGKRFNCRLLVTWNPVTKRYQYLATNLPRSKYSPEKVIEAYRLRWQIELLFKEWKSYANLKSFNTGKPSVIEGLIWGAIITATLKRYLACCTQTLFKVEISTRKVAMCASHVLEPLIIAISKARKKAILHALEKALNFFNINAERAHPKRDREKGRLKIGLTPCYG